MASYHFEAQIIGRSDGRSAIAAAAYRACEKLIDPETGQVQDYTRKSGHVSSFILAPDVAPAWALDRQQLWSAVQAKENRKNSQLCRELNLALPHELTPKQSEDMLREWIAHELVSLGMVADVAIHDPRPGHGRLRQEDESDDPHDPEVAADDQPKNRHAHVMLTMRELDNARPDGWAKGKARNWNDPALLVQWRLSWADVQNRYLERYGHPARVDGRSLEAQRDEAEARGDEIAALVLSRPPEPRLGLTAGALEAKGIATERGQALQEARQDRERLLALADTARAADAVLEDAERTAQTAANIDWVLAIPSTPVPTPEEPDMTDLTKRAVERQLKGMGLDQLELSIIGGDRPHVRTMSPAEIVADLPRLKRANKSGCSILVRGPRDQDHDLILLDDLSAFTADRMKTDGVSPAVVVETSPGSFQAWVRLGTPQPAQVRHEVSRILTAQYGGDPGAVDPHQSGRLAGLTNPKPEHRTKTGSPFVLLHRFAGRVAERAAELIEAARTALARRAEVAKVMAAPEPDADLVAWWRAGQEAVPEPRDLSRVDWHLTHVALATGRAADDVAAALEAVSDRKGRHGKDARAYAERTVAKAVASRQQTPSDPLQDRPDHDAGPSLG